jgi:uncharacterized protein (TIGR03083 family)
MDLDDVWTTIDAERAGLADLFEDLTPVEWDTPSLCDGWRVGDVAAHLTLAHTGYREVLVGAVRARGSFDRMIRDTALRAASRPQADYSRRLRAMVGSRRMAPFLTPMDPLLDVLVHGQDIALPLGRSRPMPTAAAAAAAQRAWNLRFLFHAPKRLAGLHLVASDADWTAGSGQRVEGPIAALLLLVTGRHAAEDQLTGDGVRTLRRREEMRRST